MRWRYGWPRRRTASWNGADTRLTELEAAGSRRNTTTSAPLSARLGEEAADEAERPGECRPSLKALALES